jgi:hypothetical protein
LLKISSRYHAAFLPATPSPTPTWTQRMR